MRNPKETPSPRVFDATTEFGNPTTSTAIEAHRKKANLQERTKPVIVLGINYSTQSFKL